MAGTRTDPFPSAGEPSFDDEDSGTEEAPTPSPVPWVRRADVAVAVGILVLGVVVRFVTTSPLWLDEALSVNIARLPLADIPDALRHDGHPPLYYVLLHGWMELFGAGDIATRALSGVIGLALLPLTWLTARRIGGRQVAWAGTLVLAVSPFAVRYSTEARMYSLLSVLVIGGWLLADDALAERNRPATGRLVALAVIAGLLLWTHYWSMWLLGAAGLLLLGRIVWARRRGHEAEQRSATWVLGALAVGGLTFLPWLPNLLYQAAHTGTPWALPVRPATAVVNTLADLGGGPKGESVLLGTLLFTLVLLGLVGRAVDGRRIELDLRTRPEARAPAAIVALTMTIALVAGYATQSTFATRYVAVILPLIVLLVGLGLARFGRGWAFRLAMSAVLALSLVGVVLNVITDRTQAAEAATAITAAAASTEGGAGPDALVVYCPDQLGPAMSRELPATGYEQVTYPDFANPARVDWVDYEDRLAAVDPARFAERVLDRAGPRPVYVVWSNGYRTHEESCETLVSSLATVRPGEQLLDSDDSFESMAVIRFAP